MSSNISFGTEEWTLLSRQLNRLRDLILDGGSHPRFFKFIAKDFGEDEEIDPCTNSTPNHAPAQGHAFPALESLTVHHTPVRSESKHLEHALKLRRSTCPRLRLTLSRCQFSKRLLERLEQAGAEIIICGESPDWFEDAELEEDAELSS